MPLGWLLFLAAILCHFPPALGDPGIRESPPRRQDPQQEGIILTLRAVAVLGLQGIPTALRNNYDYRGSTISNDQLATYMQAFMTSRAARLPDGRELLHSLSWAVIVWDERVETPGFTGPSQGLVLDPVCNGDHTPVNPCLTHGGALAELNVLVTDPGRPADPEILGSTTLKSFALMWTARDLPHNQAAEDAVFTTALQGCFLFPRVQPVLPLRLDRAAACINNTYGLPAAVAGVGRSSRGILVLPQAHSGVASPMGALWEAREWSTYGSEYGPLLQSGPVIRIIVLIITERPGNG